MRIKDGVDNQLLSQATLGQVTRDQLSILMGMRMRWLRKVRVKDRVSDQLRSQATLRQVAGDQISILVGMEAGDVDED